jgi:DNA polymerase IV
MSATCPSRAWSWPSSCSAKFERLSLPCSLGVATNKLLAKRPPMWGKAGSAGQRRLRPSKWCRPGKKPLTRTAAGPCIVGRGAKTAARLAELGVHTIGEIARLPEAC